MIDILLISDQKRLHDILAASGALPDGTLRVATSLDKGLEEIASHSPDILFLQNRLSGLAGYILVRHVRGATGSASPRIVLLTDGIQGSENSSADIELLTGVSDNELSDAISEIIGDQPGLQENVQTPFAGNPPPISSVPLPMINPDVTDNVSLSQSPQLSMRDPLPPPSSAVDQKGKPRSDDGHGGQATVLSGTPPPIQWEKKRLIIAVSIIVLFAVVGLLAVFIISVDKGKPSPKAALETASVKPLVNSVQPAVSSNTRQAVQPVVSSNTRHAAVPVSKPAAPALPSFVPSDGLDSRYSSTNPGWERYTSATREYKIFRESGAIQAIQVLDRQATGISPAFFSSAIREIAKVRDYRTLSREIKGDFLVKTGKLSKSAEIILYKDKSDKILRAFVIHFGAQTNNTENKGSK